MIHDALEDFGGSAGIGKEGFNQLRDIEQEFNAAKLEKNKKIPDSERFLH